MTLLEALKKTQKERIHPSLGICYHVERYTSHKYTRILHKLFRKWPHFSGNIEFPVPYNKNQEASAYLNLADLWLKSTRYGRMRRSLLQFMITELSKEQNK